MLKVRQINAAVGFPFLCSRLCAPQAIIREPVQEIAQADFRTVFRGNPRQPVGAFPGANATADANYDERVMGEAILLVHEPAPA
jgi:hypothetical protein